MASRVVLDTSVVIALLESDVAVRRSLATVEQAYLSTIVLGELHFGARKSIRVGENLERIERFADTVQIVGPDRETSRTYGALKLALREKGRMIPDNDIWIAAIALQFDLALVTRDDHFKEVDHLRIENW